MKNIAKLVVLMMFVVGCKKVKRGEAEKSEPTRTLAPKPEIPESVDIPSKPSPSRYFTLEVVGHDGNTVWYVYWKASERVESISIACAGESPILGNPSFDWFEKQIPGGGLSGNIKISLVPNTRYTCGIAGFFPFGGPSGYGAFFSNSIVLITSPPDR